MSTLMPPYGGDIWSSSDFALDSPLTDLLDSGEFTLEQILREDELLQEVKSVHPQLIDFLAQYTSLSTLIDYLVCLDDGTSATHHNNNNSTSADYGEEDGIEYVSSMDAQENFQYDGAEVKGHNEVFCFEGDNDNNNNGNHIPVIASTHRVGTTEEIDQNAMEIDENISDGRKSEAYCLGGKNLLTNAADYDNSPFMFIEEESNNYNSKTNDTDDDEEYLTLRRIRYPYMACEIVCCENPRILDIFIYGKNERSGITLLDQFFTILDLSPDKLDDRHAGYFEKIITVLLRTRTKPLMDYINQRGLELFEKFMNHLQNYSIMSILERLLLPSPHIAECETVTASSTTENPEVDLAEGIDNSNTTSVISLCTWGENIDIISSLVDKLVEDNTPDSVLATHSSELLVSRVHQAPLTSPILQLLSSGKVLQKIVRKSSFLSDSEEFTSHDNGMTRALFLLESIVLQLGGFGCVPPVDASLSLSFTYPNSLSLPQTTTALSPAQENGSVVSSCIENNPAEAAESKPSYSVANSNDLISLLPDSLSRWDSFLTHETTKSWQVINQIGQVIPMVGLSRLRIVRLIEALVLLAHPIVDEQLVKANSIRICLDLFFAFEWCSMLHQSVANLLVHVLEGDGSRLPLQMYLINDLQLLERLISAYEKNFDSCSLNPVDSQVVFRPGFLGHVIIVCQAIAHVCAPTLPPNNYDAAEGEAAQQLLVNSQLTGQNGTHPPPPAYYYSDLTPLATIISQSSFCQRWKDFASTKLSAITAVQSTPLGGSSPPSRAGAEMQSQEDDVLQMDESELEIAATMIESMKIPCDDEEENGRDRKKQSLLSDFVDSGDQHSREYCFDDPLGRTDRIGDEMYTEHSDVALFEEDDEADAPVLDLFAGNFGSSSFSSVPVDTKTNDELSFFADFGNNFQVETVAAPSTEEFAAFDDAAFDQNFDRFASGNPVTEREFKDDVFPRITSEVEGEEIDLFGTAKFNIDEIF